MMGKHDIRLNDIAIRKFCAAEFFTYGRTPVQNPGFTLNLTRSSGPNLDEATTFNFAILQAIYPIFLARDSMSLSLGFEIHSGRGVPATQPDA